MPAPQTPDGTAPHWPLNRALRDEDGDIYDVVAGTFMVVGLTDDSFGSLTVEQMQKFSDPVSYTHLDVYKRQDEKFATLITEAEKYLGYPYVWGGSNPDTSFDCSGFVSYVLTNSGLVNTGRLGAQGLYNVCTPVSRRMHSPVISSSLSGRMTPPACLTSASTLVMGS